VRNAVPGSADDGIPVDVAPRSKIDRPLARKILHSQAALSNFFTSENLSAVREVAVREVAEEVKSNRTASESGGREHRRSASVGLVLQVLECVLCLADR
jgi:K+-sensing histidine kinase KdpD